MSVLQGFGVPYFSTFSGTCYLKGTIMKCKSIFFLPGYFKAQIEDVALLRVDDRDDGQ